MSNLPQDAELEVGLQLLDRFSESIEPAFPVTHPALVQYRRQRELDPSPHVYVIFYI
jgi:hypothetical protein